MLTPAGVFAIEPASVRPFRAMGFNLIALQTDVHCLRMGARALLDAAKAD